MTVKNYIDGMFKILKVIDTYNEQLDSLVNEGKITSGARWYLLCPHNQHFYNAFFDALGKVHKSKINEYGALN